MGFAQNQNVPFLSQSIPLPAASRAAWRGLQERANAARRPWASSIDVAAV
jgi:hypothetical protein